MLTIHIKKAIIYGFGKWVDYTIDFNNESFICIYGENESGKSTLQKFILFMLFGLPPKQRAFFQPKKSSKMGGRLFIQDPKIGEFSIERFDDVRNGSALCHTPDGKEYGEPFLQQYLGGMTAKTYESIFSFSVQDLSGIKHMSEEDMGEVLLGIGLTGSTQIYTIEKRLEAKIGELFKPYGKNPAINKQLETLNQLQKSLLTYQNEENTYREKKLKTIELTSDIKDLQEEIQNKKAELIRLEKERQALPYIYDYFMLTKQLADLPKNIPFPEDGQERLQYLKDKLLPYQSELSILQADEEKYTKKVEEMLAELDISLPTDQVEQILQRKQKYIENNNELKKLQLKIDELEIQIKSELRNLNIGLIPEQLSSISLPFQIEKIWNDLKLLAEQIEMDKERLDDEKQLLLHKQTFLETQLKELDVELLSDDDVAILQERVNEHKEYNLLMKFQTTINEKRNQLKNNMARQQKRSNTIIISLSIIAFLSGLISILLQNASSLYKNIMLISILIIFVQWLWSKKSKKTMESMLEYKVARIPEIKSTDEEKEEAEKKLSVQAELKQEQTLLFEQLKSTDIQLIQLDEKNKSLDKREQKLNKQVHEQYNRYPFLQNITISFWPDLFHSIKNLLRIDREKQECEREVRLIREKQLVYCKQVNDLIKESEWEFPYANLEVEEQLAMIENKVEKDKEAKHLLNQFNDILKENRKMQHEVKQKMKAYRDEINALYNIAEVDNEEMFHRKASQLQTKKQLKLELAKITSRLEASFSTAEREKLLENKPTETQFELARQQCESKLSDTEDLLETKRQQLANIHAELTKMESSDSYSQTIHQFQMQRGQLQRLAKKWAIYKTAKEMLVETKRNFRDKYVNKVIDRTSEHFQFLTESKYIHVFAPIENKPFLVEANDHTRYKVSELSQGTIDQLYVSLRLAISEIMGMQHDMAFIIDDAFVQFDSIRMKRILQILEKVSEKRQIILFTCKKEIVNTVQNATIVNLGSCVSNN